MDAYPFERVITIEGADDHAAAEALVDRVFGPGRYVKTAERLREGNRPLADLSFVMRQITRGRRDDGVLGSVRLWPVRVYDALHEVVGTLAFLGPIAVDPDHQNHGVGRALVEVAVKAAFNQGVTGVLLVGTPAYFEKFGFVRAEGLTLPGPVDYRRLMIRYNDGYAGAPLTGAVAQ